MTKLSNPDRKPNIVISPECLEWARSNGHSSEADSTEKMVSAYREWQRSIGRRSMALLYRDPEELERQITKAQALIERYRQVLRLKASNNV